MARRCFCGSTPDPKPPRLATPHSCGNSCSRPRPCNHPCPISCHPGPCPPCQVTLHLPCHCEKRSLAFKCANLLSSKNFPKDGAARAELSCGQTCGKKLSCGNHTCQQTCHEGECQPCSIKAAARCYCGKTEQQLSCGSGRNQSCRLYARGSEVQEWVGQFECQQICNR